MNAYLKYKIDAYVNFTARLHGINPVHQFLLPKSARKLVFRPKPVF